MPVAYDKVTTDNHDLNVVQAHVQRAFENAAAQADVPTEADGIVRLDTARGVKVYAVRDADRHVVVLTNGSPATVGLPAPTIKRIVGILANGANPVTVQRKDGKACSFGQTKTLQNSASLFVADGQDWFTA